MTAAVTPKQQLTPQARFDAIRNLLRESEQMQLTACQLLSEANRNRDWEALGFANMTAYVVEGLGLEQSTGSKLLAAARVFCGNTEPAWKALPAKDQRELSASSLYEASKMVTEGSVSGERWEPQQALHEAVVHTATHIRGIRHGREPFTSHPCVCRDCGNHHYAPNQVT